MVNNFKEKSTRSALNPCKAFWFNDEIPSMRLQLLVAVRPGGSLI
jgi:hypothetical protein